MARLSARRPRRRHRGSKPRAVLAVLLLHANEPVSAERIAQALWGEDAPAAPSKTVQVHVSRLRKALGDADDPGDDAGGLPAARQPGELDAERFERLVEDGRAALAGRAARGGGRRAARGAARCGAGRRSRISRSSRSRRPRSRGSRSSGWPRSRRASRPTSRPAARRAGRRAAAAGGRASRRASGSSAQLMLALYRCGRQAEALEAYRDGTPRLAERGRRRARAGAARAAGGDPATTTRARHGAGGRAAARARRAAAPPLLGRDAELAWLRERWERGARRHRRGWSWSPAPPGWARRGWWPSWPARRTPRRRRCSTRPARRPAERSLSARRAPAGDAAALLVVDDADGAGGDVLAAVARGVAADRRSSSPSRSVAEAVAALEPTACSTSSSSARGGRRDRGAYAPDRGARTCRPSGSSSASGGVPRRVHDVASQWARREAARRMGAVAGRTAAGRAELRSMEAELAGGVVAAPGRARVGASPAATTRPGRLPVQGPRRRSRRRRAVLLRPRAARRRARRAARRRAAARRRRAVGQRQVVGRAGRAAARSRGRRPPGSEDWPQV